MAKPTNTPNPSARHTPGPWRADEYGVRDRGGYICKIVWPTRFPDQNERYAQEVAERTADVRLIAAAPDLLEELKHCGAALEGVANMIRPNFAHGAALFDVAAERVRQVIAKAEGRHG